MDMGESISSTNCSLIVFAIVRSIVVYKTLLYHNPFKQVQ